MRPARPLPIDCTPRRGTPRRGGSRGVRFGHDRGTAGGRQNRGMSNDALRGRRFRQRGEYFAVIPQGGTSGARAAPKRTPRRARAAAGVLKISPRFANDGRWRHRRLMVDSRQAQERAYQQPTECARSEERERKSRDACLRDTKSAAG